MFRRKEKVVNCCKINLSRSFLRKMKQNCGLKIVSSCRLFQIVLRRSLKIKTAHQGVATHSLRTTALHRRFVGPKKMKRLLYTACRCVHLMSAHSSAFEITTGSYE